MLTRNFKFPRLLKVKEDECGRACRSKWNAYMILVGKLEVKRPLERPWCRWENKI
jgi:hypothetical protein